MTQDQDVIKYPFGGEHFKPIVSISSNNISHFQVIGERCSGTNFLDSAVAKNTFLRRTKVFSWKHGFPNFLAIPNNVILIVIVRNAISWCRSMFSKPWHTNQRMRKLVFSDFIRSPWETIVDQENFFDIEFGDNRKGSILQFDRHPITGNEFSNIFKLRTEKLRSHLGILNRSTNAIIVTHEFLTKNPSSFFKILSNEFSIITKEHLIFSEKKFGWEWPHREPNLLMPPVNLSDEDRAFLLQEIDEHLESSFGYFYR